MINASDISDVRARRGSQPGFRLACEGGVGPLHLSTRRFRALACSVAFVLAVVCALGSPAYADVLPTDVVCGATVQERGLDEQDCPDISAASAIVVDEDGTVYFERSADEPRKIASLTKIMTAIVALENAPLDTTVTVGKAAATVGESSAGLLEGDSMSLETALYCLLVPSGNDAAIAIADTVGAMLADDGQNAQDAFVSAMNAKAVEIGCTDTDFDNPHGLDFDAWAGDGHSTSRDVAVMAAYAMKNDTFRAIVGGGSTTVTVESANGVARTLSLISTDELMGSFEGLCGIKTGTTDDAGYCFAGACVRDDRELYSVVLGSGTSEGRFDDTARLLDWAYDNFRDVGLISVPSTVDYDGEAYPLVAQVALSDWVDASVSATVEDPDLSAEIFTAEGAIEQTVEFDTLEGGVSKGDVVGRIEFTQDGESVAECDLIAADDAPAPDFFQRIGVWWDRLFRKMQGQPTVAESVCFNRTASVMDR